MPTLALTQNTFEEKTAQGIALVDFWAAWCGPCRTFAPIFEAASERHPDVTFAKVDTEAEPGLAASFEVRAIPTLAIMRDGIVLGVQAGMLPGPALDQLVAKVRELDMDDIRRQMSESASAAETG